MFHVSSDCRGEKESRGWKILAFRILNQIDLCVHVRPRLKANRRSKYFMEIDIAGEGAKTNAESSRPPSRSSFQ